MQPVDKLLQLAEGLHHICILVSNSITEVLPEPHKDTVTSYLLMRENCGGFKVQVTMKNIKGFVMSLLPGSMTHTHTLSTYHEQDECHENKRNETDEKKIIVTTITKEIRCKVSNVYK